MHTYTPSRTPRAFGQAEPPLAPPHSPPLSPEDCTTLDALLRFVVLPRTIDQYRRGLERYHGLIASQLRRPEVKRYERGSESLDDADETDEAPQPRSRFHLDWVVEHTRLNLVATAASFGYLIGTENAELVNARGGRAGARTDHKRFVSASSALGCSAEAMEQLWHLFGEDIEAIWTEGAAGSKDRWILSKERRGLREGLPRRLTRRQLLWHICETQGALLSGAISKERVVDRTMARATWLARIDIDVHARWFREQGRASVRLDLESVLRRLRACEDALGARPVLVAQSSESGWDANGVHAYFVLDDMYEVGEVGRRVEERLRAHGARVAPGWIEVRVGRGTGKLCKPCRLPLGRGSRVLDRDTLEPIFTEPAWNRKGFEIEAVVSALSPPWPADSKVRLGERRAPKKPEIVSAEPRDEVPAGERPKIILPLSDIVGAAELLAHGLRGQGERFQALLTLNRVFQEIDGLSPEQAGLRLWEWLVERNNGLSRNYNADPARQRTECINIALAWPARRLTWENRTGEGPENAEARIRYVLAAVPRTVSRATARAINDLDLRDARGRRDLELENVVAFLVNLGARYGQSEEHGTVLVAVSHRLLEALVPKDRVAGVIEALATARQRGNDRPLLELVQRERVGANVRRYRVSFSADGDHARLRCIEAALDEAYPDKELRALYGKAAAARIKVIARSAADRPPTWLEARRKPNARGDRSAPERARQQTAAEVEAERAEAQAVVAKARRRYGARPTAVTTKGEASSLPLLSMSSLSRQTHRNDRAFGPQRAEARRAAATDNLPRETQGSWSKIASEATLDAIEGTELWEGPSIADDANLFAHGPSAFLCSIPASVVGGLCPIEHLDPGWWVRRQQDANLILKRQPGHPWTIADHRQRRNSERDLIRKVCLDCQWSDPWRVARFVSTLQPATALQGIHEWCTRNLDLLWDGGAPRAIAVSGGRSESVRRLDEGPLVPFDDVQRAAKRALKARATKISRSPRRPPSPIGPGAISLIENSKLSFRWKNALRDLASFTAGNMFTGLELVMLERKLGRTGWVYVELRRDVVEGFEGVKRNSYKAFLAELGRSGSAAGFPWETPTLQLALKYSTKGGGRGNIYGLRHELVAG